MTLIDKTGPVLIDRPGRPLSQILSDLEAGEGERVSVGAIVGALRDRSFAPLMIIFAAPNVFLFIPGSSFFTGLPLIALALQLILGRPDVWLPRFVAELSIARSAFSRIVTVSVPYIRRIERLARPRWWPTSFLSAERMIGVATLILAVFLFLPIPFANGLPALSIIMLALGLSERDGFWLAGGLALAVAASAIAGGMVFVSIEAALNLIF